jgi:branched-chain amino acid aminotransferase
MTLAEKKGMTVVRRPVRYTEIPTFREVVACGTAVVITPVNHFVHGDVEYTVGPSEGAGPVFQDLYDTVRGIQMGEIADEFGWITEI